jgi:hypothetical protein
MCCNPIHPICGSHSRYTTFVYRPSHLPTIRLVNLRSDFNFNSSHQGPQLYILLVFDSPGPNFTIAQSELSLLCEALTPQHSDAVCWANFGSLDIFRHVSLLVYDRGHISFKHSGV